MAIKGKQHEAAIDAYLVLAKLYKGSERSRMYSALGEVYGKELNDLPNAMKFLKKAREAGWSKRRRLSKNGHRVCDDQSTRLGHGQFHEGI